MPKQRWLKFVTLLALVILVSLALLTRSNVQATSKPGSSVQKTSARSPKSHRVWAAPLTGSDATATNSSTCAQPCVLVWGNGTSPGGSVQKQPVAYVIFWGSYWVNNQGQLKASGRLAVNYLHDVGGTSFENILTQYYDASAHIANTESLAGMWVDTSLPPTTIGDCGPSYPDIHDSDIRKEIDKAIQTNGWPKDNPNVTYFVYTPPATLIYKDDISSGSPCSETISSNKHQVNYCGYHFYSNTNQDNTAYAEVVYPNNARCTVPTSPNKNPAGDSLVNMTAHEQFEAITDPDASTGWADSTGQEMGDKCENVKNLHTLSLNHGGVFEIQSMYSNASRACVTSYTQKFQVSPGALQVTTTYGTNPAPQTLNIQNTGGTLNWQLHTGVPGWLTVTPTSGSVPSGSSSPITLTFDTLRYGPQTLFTSLTFSDPHQSTSSFQVPITVTIQGTQPGNWPMFGYDLQHTQYNPYETVLNPTNVSNLTLDWSYDTGSGIFYSSAAVVNGLVYIGSQQLDAIDLTTHTLKWSFAAKSSFDSSPSVVNGVVYAGSDDGSLYAADALTGALKWSFSTGNTVQSSPVVSNGIVYFGSWNSTAYNGTLYALDATTGTLKWQFTTSGGFNTGESPAVANGIVYTGSADGKLYAFDAVTGTLKWSVVVGSNDNSPTIANGVVYLTTASGLFAFDAATGTQRWVFSSINSYTSSPAVANGVVFAVSANGTAYALNATTGGLVWSHTLGLPYVCTPAVANGVLYCAVYNGTLYALDAATGSQLWSTALGSIDGSSVVVASGVIYVGSMDSSLYAFHLTGTTP